VRWLKFIRITLGGILVLASLANAVVAITVDGADYRDALVRLVEGRSATRLSITGPCTSSAP
jgi:hypothetical protein